MKKHLYNSKLSKVAWFVRRFGVQELWRKPWRIALAPLIIPRLPRGSFEFRGARLDYFYHRYNMTWACERCLEVPIARSYVGRFPAARVLEVGNVLSHYFPVEHRILDKFEQGRNVMNQDVVEFASNEKFELVISISTFEHIGFDDEAEGSSTEKILAAIASCRQLLSASGRLVITVPLGYNPAMNDLISTQRLGSTREYYYRRPERLRWEPCDRAAALACNYRCPFPYANALLVAEFGPSP